MRHTECWPPRPNPPSPLRGQTGPAFRCNQFMNIYRRGSTSAVLTVVFAAIALVFGLSGCDSGTSQTSTQQSSAALDAYVNENRAAIETQLEQRFGDVYSDVSAEGEGSSTIVFRYTFREPVGEAGRAALENQESTLQTIANDQILPEMIAAGIDDPSVRWIYQDPDGSVVVELSSD